MKVKLKSTKYPDSWVGVELDTEIIKDMQGIYGLDGAEELSNIIFVEMQLQEDIEELAQILERRVKFAALDTLQPVSEEQIKHLRRVALNYLLNEIPEIIKSFEDGTWDNRNGS